MHCKVPYTEIEGRHRPYLEVVFYNGAMQKNSSKTFGMIDSGADHTVIPYSIGSSIGLAVPTSAERIASASGVGGNVSYVERVCSIYIANRVQGEIYEFSETVWWVYPDAETQKKRNVLAKNYANLKKFSDIAGGSIKSKARIKKQMNQAIDDWMEIGRSLETNVLLGRPFFDNFEFIQFCHKDRNEEDKCFFVYKVKEDKIVSTSKIQQS